MTLIAEPQTTSPPRPTQPPVAGRVALVGRSAVGAGICDQLETRGYVVRQAPDLAGARALLAGAEAVILLAPAGSEAQAARDCQRLSRRPGASVIVVYAGAQAGFAVDALEAGADDCVCAPVNPREVVARVRAALRRRALGERRSRLEQVGALVIDHVQMRVRLPDDRILSLTPAQFRLLGALARRQGAVVARETLVAEVLGEDSDSYDRAIDVQICRLRKRLAQVGLGKLISAMPGVGYRLSPAPDRVGP
ncbi:response regulator transcription factor [Phenylobacterium soli]|uniref:DNA-binding response regulator n=1 Tax=Phenylobacterium soli TaxID=2170551 RepID=A0A328AB12_9CAUL|nr:response regulator transcription factor [Phenylobacterium soli]RAK51801.1 hypothetical protein DJ017_18445 [Phenylobacterium soli]